VYTVVPILIQMNPVHNLPPYFPKIQSDIFPSTSRSSEWFFLSFRYHRPKYRMHFSSSPCVLHVSPITPSNLPPLPLGSKYSPQHHVLKHPHPMLLQVPQPYKITGRRMGLYILIFKILKRSREDTKLNRTVASRLRI